MKICRGGGRSFKYESEQLLRILRRSDVVGIVVPYGTYNSSPPLTDFILKIRLS